MEFFLALQFLTMIPITIRGKVDGLNLARSMAWFPLVGLILGLLAALVYSVFSHVLPAPVCDLLVILVMVMVTGNMHADGLMDTVDGIFSGKPKAKVLEIMKDSRVGSHGLIAGVFDILARFVLLGQLPADYKIAALIIIPVIGRWSQVYGAAAYPYARQEGGTGSFAENVGRRELFWASATVLGTVAAVLAGLNWLTELNIFYTVTLQWLEVIFGTLAGIVWLGRYLSRKLEGLTGDTYGALTEAAEILALTLILVVLGR